MTSPSPSEKDGEGPVRIHAEGSAELRTALDTIWKLAAIINATPREAFKGWPSDPYKSAKSAEDFAGKHRVIVGTTHDAPVSAIPRSERDVREICARICEGRLAGRNPSDAHYREAVTCAKLIRDDSAFARLDGAAKREGQ